ncbi:hypothetical protein F7725_008949 [Dissostichus mawsoni]|uniref:Ig-like domain-containing protein n=1 Tax=Dissostichus mawsoni TaxID=36200 RepID=A0A7J5Z652_DISMA|nr:hypothetical protein F7725_008949 [Dissostichus mawsoni]
MLLILTLNALLFTASMSQITGYGNTTVAYGRDSKYGCAVADPTGVLQVTWQRLFPDRSIENLATYNRRFGEHVNDPYRGKVIFTEAMLSSSSITLANVTWADESCYICSFNVYPDGSMRKQISVTLRKRRRRRKRLCSAALLQENQLQPYIANGDKTFTSSSNITLRLPAGWEGHVDCLLNSGAMGQRSERIPFSLPAREKPEEEGLSALVETQHTVMAAVGEESCLQCQLMQSKNVLQVTWQKVLPVGVDDIATYTRKFGQTVNAGFKGRVEFKTAGLQNCSINIMNVTERDEGCYRCLFNTLPEGAFIGITCLKIYELHGPFLHVVDSVVSCSATGRPAPTLTLTLPHNNSTTVANSNGTVTVTMTARLHDNSREVGCDARVLSSPHKEASMAIPEVKISSDDDGKTQSTSGTALVTATVVSVTFIIIIIVIIIIIIIVEREWLDMRLYSSVRLDYFRRSERSGRDPAHCDGSSGRESCLQCQLMQSKNVLQVTWQKILPIGEDNIATYTRKFGQTVNAGFKGRVEFKTAGLQNCSINIMNVTDRDEGCYRCLFNTIPKLHGPFLHVLDSVVSCSATGRPAPTVTLTLPHNNSTSVTNSNGTFTVTVTARLHNNSREVGCAARVLSAPHKEASMAIPEVKMSAIKGFKEDSRPDNSGVALVRIIVSVVLCSVCVAVAIIAFLVSEKDSEMTKSPQKSTKDSLEARTPLMTKVNELRLRWSSVKKEKPSETSNLKVKKNLFS